MTPYLRAVDKFKDKKVLIFGLGLLGGGVGDARFFSDLGSKVRVTDSKSKELLRPSIDKLSTYPIDYTLGHHDIADIEWADVILRNPSIPENHPLLQEAIKKNKTIYMRTSLFVELASVTTIGITGTRGKTTTTTMIYELAKALSGKTVLLGGNISGVSDLELLNEIKDPSSTLAVLELSSWALQGFAQSHLSPNIGVVTNLYPDHLNVYADLDSYYNDKKQIMTNQSKSDHIVLNHNQPECIQWANNAPSQVHWFDEKNIPPQLQLIIPGDHNRLNACAALKVAEICCWSEQEAIKIVNAFTGVPYRLQTIATKKGITYINDTTATTPVATITALHSFAISPILICGGNDKNLPLEQLVKEINVHAKAIILLPGTGTERLKKQLSLDADVVEVHSMNEAVSYATAKASLGDIILLSPAFTSFGLFSNEFDRGDQFNQCVQHLS